MTTSKEPPHPYPPAPWRLSGSALAVLRPVDRRIAERYVPPGLKVVNVLPGKTLGGILLAQYGAGSTLEYNELIVFCGVVRRGWRLGGWISHIYVDHQASLAGGREIWGLPKERAEFLREGGSVVVVQGTQALLRVKEKPRDFALPIPLWLPAWCEKAGSLFTFTARGRCNAGLTGLTLEVPATSPLSDILPARAARCLRMERLDILVPAPAEGDGVSKKTDQEPPASAGV